MKRRHLFEFEDLPGFPALLRNYMTDYLRFLASTFDFYRGVVPVFHKGLEKSGSSTIVDLASGGGGGLEHVADRLRADHPDLKIVLTDLYPNERAFASIIDRNPEVFSFESGSVNALDVPEHLQGLRTQLLSLHHFRPREAQQILQSAVDSDAAIAVFELQRRDLSHFVKFMGAPLGALLLTPFIRPFRWGRLLFTYVIPVLPFLVLWDGLVSVLRTYTTAELDEMTGNLAGGDHYRWEQGEEGGGIVRVRYLLGYPERMPEA